MFPNGLWDSSYTLETKILYIYKKHRLSLFLKSNIFNNVLFDITVVVVFAFLISEAPSL
jgi:ABC-type transport system involved in cytochrome c biogenesis permease component